MNSSTSNSEVFDHPESPQAADRARRFLGLLVLLIVAVELCFSLFTQADRGRHEVDHRIATIAGLDWTPKAVLLSDSVSFGVLDLLDPVPGVLDLSSNRSVTVVGNTFLVRRLFERMHAAGLSTEGLRVVYAVGPESLQADLDSTNFLESYFTSVFTRPEEIADAEAQLGRPRLTELMQQGQRDARWQFPSHERRGLLIYPLSGVLRRLKTKVMPQAKIPEHVTAGFEAKFRELSSMTRFVPSEATFLYLNHLWKECDENGARLTILVPPMPPSLVAHWEENGFLPSFRAWLGGFQRDHAGTLVVESPAWELGGDPAFYDGVHLLPEAKAEWGRRLGAFLGTPSNGISGPRSPQEGPKE